MKVFKLFFVAFAIFVLSVGFSACEKKSNTDMRKVHWDRDMCERCKMVLSDRKHAVQVINPLNGKSTMYDDIGCTVLWFEDEKIDWAPKAKIWITDSITGKWIDARTACYATQHITPMAYGFGAHEHNTTINAKEEVIDFIEVSKRIMKREADMRSAH